tara:strand:+ start:4538 stop:5224 length:687 start_codon:yes stop_codon:yes gene_type:complete
MGFLDHSTNNIIVDAVLTDIGRQALAKNDGSFSIYQFALGDDEIDYGIIQQFGRTVGKEKIEKNTPVMEALTVGSLGLKHPLVSISNEFLTHMPTLTLTSKTNPITFDRKSNVSINTLNIEIASQTGTTIEYDLLDPEVLVEINHMFLSIVGETPDINYTDNIAVFRMPTSQSSTGDSITAKIPLRVKSFATSTFNTYSVAGSSYIRTYVKIIGINSGLTKTIEVNIS